MAPSRFLEEIPRESIRWAELEEQSGDFPVGSGADHEEYGTGVVEKRWYTDGALLVRVRFHSGRVAESLPKYARLKGDNWTDKDWTGHEGRAEQRGLPQHAHTEGGDTEHPLSHHRSGQESGDAAV